MAIDRRVARTRTALYDALVRLIRDRDYDAISVEDILREANVGRSTFYAHFTSKDDLLKNSLERLKTLLVATRDQHRLATQEGAQTEAWDASRALFEHVHEYTDIQLALAGGRGDAVLGEALSEVLADVLRDSLPAQTVEGVPRELAIRHIVATFYTILHWWVRGRRDIAPVEADRLFKTLLVDGLPPAWRDAFVASFGEPANDSAADGNRTTRN
ncbi:helix-turn-helix domain-containing protein [Mesorhizobium sp. KR9-304]|uniref:TetR/AcrR family transcriptional regulator n=1 Tax=Mesorhizobium sp. KR9-304 TaxID=3156614 RepID=UPI0032B59B92